MRQYLLIISTAFTTGLVYIFSVYDHNIDRSFATYQSIVDGTGLSPNRYRVLLHYIMNFFVPDAKENIYLFVTASGIVGFLMVMLVVVLFYIWMRTITPPQKAFMATFALAFILMGMFQAIWVIFDTPQLIEAIAIILTLAFIQKQPIGWRWWILIILILACLNRATGGMVALIYIVARFSEGRRDLVWSGIYLTVGVGVFAGLRLVLGVAPAITEPFEGTLYILTRDPADAILWNSALLPIFIVAFSNYNRLPMLLQRALWLVPLYTFAILLRAEINEIGLWLTIMPFLIPAALWHISDEAEVSDSN